jgi:hypothetical protein
MSGDTPYHSIGRNVTFAVVSSRTLTERCRSCCHLSYSSVPVLRRQGGKSRIGSEVVEAHGGCQDMEERVEAIRDLGGEDERTLRLCALAETPPAGHGRCARRQHISRLQQKEQ